MKTSGPMIEWSYGAYKAIPRANSNRRVASNVQRWARPKGPSDQFELKYDFDTFYDESGSIGRRYRRLEK